MSNIMDRVTEALTLDAARAVDAIWGTPEFRAMGSEIERAMAAHMVIGPRISGAFTCHLGYPGDNVPGVFLSPQHPIGKYRVDFLFGFGDRRELRDCVAIECDGFDFHDRTPEMAARDKARDRELNQHVLAVVRFTGREIYRDVGQCWIDAGKILMRRSNK